MPHAQSTPGHRCPAQAESASAILVTRSNRNPQVDDPGVLCCLDRWGGACTTTAPQGRDQLPVGYSLWCAGSPLWCLARSARTRSSRPAAQLTLPLLVRVLIDQRCLLGGLA